MILSDQELLSNNYIQHNVPTHEKYKILFQKKFTDENGIKYYLDCRKWSYDWHESYDFHLCSGSDSNGYVWCTFKEDTLKLAENRAEKLWESLGKIYYERN
jgi:hypothetical protein